MTVNQNRSKSWATLAALAACVGVSASSFGAVRVNDTWLDGTRTDPAAPVYSENGVDADADGNLESAWYQGGVGTLAPVGPGGPLRADMGDPMGTSSASWTTYFTPEAGQITLQQGDTLRVTWQFTPTGVNTTNTSQGLRLAVVDTPDATRLTAEGAPPDGAYTGYAMFMNMGQTLGHSSSFRLMERNVASGNLLASSGNWTSLGTTGATNGNDGYDDGVSYTFTMDLTRNASDQLEIVSRMAGGTLDNDGLAEVIFTDATPHGGSFTFDTFALRPLNATTTAPIFDTTLFQVDYIPIPEPTSLALLGLGGMALLRRRSRS